MRAFALKRRGEARPDTLAFNRFKDRLEVEWRAREIHPSDRDLPAARIPRLFVEHCLDDPNAALERLFCELPEIDVIEFKVTHPISGVPIMSGCVAHLEARTVKAQSAAMRLKQLGVTYRLHNWQFEPLV